MCFKDPSTYDRHHPTKNENKNSWFITSKYGLPRAGEAVLLHGHPAAHAFDQRRIHGGHAQAELAVGVVKVLLLLLLLLLFLLIILCLCIVGPVGG